MLDALFGRPKKTPTTTTTPAPKPPVKEYPAVPPTSEILRDIPADATEIPVLSAAPFTMPARFDARGEKIRCTTKVVGTGEDWVTNCERGADQRLGGTVPQAHPGGTRLVQDVLGIRDVPFFLRGNTASPLVNTAAVWPFTNYEYTFGQGELTQGRVIRLQLAGDYASGATPGTIQFYVFLDNVEGTSHQITFNNPLPLTVPANVVGANWTFDGYVNVIKQGGAPFLECVGTFTLWADDNSFQDSLYAAGGTFTFNAAQAQRLFFGGRRSVANAANTMNMNYALLEAVN